VKEYITPEWESILRFNDLDGFNSLWELQAEWFEPPNERRGGWSGVARIELDLPGGGREAVFLKRQENHTRRTFSNLIFGEPTFAGEIKNILLLSQAGVPTMDPLYYGQRKVDGKWRAILVTRELAGFRSLIELADEWNRGDWKKSIPARRKLITVLATVIRNMHEHKLVHNSLHPKHVFVRLTEGGPPEVALIDLEKMRRTISVKSAMLRDLDSLNRRAYAFGRTDRVRFLTSYFHCHKLNSEGKRVWRHLARKSQKFQSMRAANVS
jgi:hypothetical protein